MSPRCRECLDNGIIFDKNELAIPCPMCDAWMEPEGSAVLRGTQQQPKPKSKDKKKQKQPKQQPKQVKIELTDEDMSNFFDDLYDLDDDDPSTWGTWWDDDDYDIDSPLRPVSPGGSSEQIHWWDDPDDPFGPLPDEIGRQRSQRGKNPRTIQKDKGKGIYKFTPPKPASFYVKDVPEREKPEGDWFEYDTRWFNEDVNQHVLHTVRKLTETYPVTKGWFKGIRVSDVPPTACVVPNDRKIWLTPSFLNKPGSAYGKGRHYDDDELDRLVAHEFGHVLHASILKDSAGESALPDLDMNDLMKRNYSGDSLSHPDSPATYIMEEGKQKVKNTYITGYAETDELERFAEAMCEHWTSRRPPELASYVGDRIDFLYHKNKGINKANAYESWWEQTIDKQDKKQKEKDEYKSWWEETTGQSTKTARGPVQVSREKLNADLEHRNIMEFISPKEHLSIDQKLYREWWNKKYREQYEAWWAEQPKDETTGETKVASVSPDVLYLVAPMNKREAFLNNGIAPTIMYANETDAKVAAHERSEIEPQDIWYIDPDGLDISPRGLGWEVRASVTADNIMQIEGWDPDKNGHPLKTAADIPEQIVHEDEHQPAMKFAGRIADVEYYIASCKCGWSSNIRTAQAAQNAWQRHSDSLNEPRRRDLAGPATPERFKRRPESKKGWGRFGSKWNQIRFDSTFESTIGYEYDKQGIAHHAEAARPRQGKEASGDGPLRGPDEEALETVGSPQEGIGFSPEDIEFLDNVNNWPDMEDVQAAHDAVGGAGIEDPEAIESAIGAVQNSYFFGQSRNIYHLAADLIDKIAARQAILNGNKRTATFTALDFLDNAGYNTDFLPMAEEVECPQCFGGAEKQDEDRCYFCEGENKVPPLARLVNGLADGARVKTTPQDLEDFLSINIPRR